MQKIISLFQRNYETDRFVRDDVVSGAEWVLAGDGVATRKRDGTACRVHHGVLEKRYDAKAGRTPPAGFIPAQPAADPVTGHWPGWVAVGDGPEDRWHREAWAVWNGNLADGTYELIGPRVQGGAEGVEPHTLIRHGSEPLTHVPRDYAGLIAYLSLHVIEGVVWWRNSAGPHCDKVKIKRKDFGLSWGSYKGVRGAR